MMVDEQRGAGSHQGAKAMVVRAERSLHRLFPIASP